MTPLLPQTPSQTVGPFFHDGLVRAGENRLAHDGARGMRIVLSGRVIDGAGEAVPDALVEIWQADAAGIHGHPADPRASQADPQFAGFGRSDTRHAGGCFLFETVKPGPVAVAGGRWQAPHVSVRVFARGLLTHLATRLYFSDEPAANANDPVLASIPPVRRDTLVAVAAPPEGGVAVYRLDIVLQGERETVFFEP